MTDNDVEIAVRKQLLAQLAQAGIDIPVRAGFQSAKQGREDNFVMFFPAGENPQGWQKR
ncbi:phage gateway protein, partial [Morganella morganii]|uniref:phage gateway protein n=2 Tax=Morganellaceae TaxID=1903414 RepID=UPI003F7FE9EC